MSLSNCILHLSDHPNCIKEEEKYPDFPIT